MNAMGNENHEETWLGDSLETRNVWKRKQEGKMHHYVPNSSDLV